ncbi:hypothetical protein C470_04781 [Halorubrum distributum JCM 13561]|uniref:Uncharacterized protein n=1 Tax=Halorubrum distributum JCM 13561 TaxID=1227483 RepID=M0P0C0_9EURY|nr:hypothetical protein [Halorubrum litoreum]EMA62270.1 hypothetical protein C470_04781 [Halorubrum litoreum JCM 13561]
METPRVVRENLGYALLGGPALAAVAFVAGAESLGAAAGVAVAVATYALGWALSARRSGSGSERSPSERSPPERSPPERSPSNADDERDRREREAEAGKGGFGGGGGG